MSSEYSRQPCFIQSWTQKLHVSNQSSNLNNHIGCVLNPLTWHIDWPLNWDTNLISSPTGSIAYQALVAIGMKTIWLDSGKYRAIKISTSLNLTTVKKQTTQLLDLCGNLKLSDVSKSWVVLTHASKLPVAFRAVYMFILCHCCSAYAPVIFTII